MLTATKVDDPTGAGKHQALLGNFASRLKLEFHRYLARNQMETPN